MPAFQPSFFDTSRNHKSPKPFLKWAGGKSQLLEQFTPYFPKQFAQYHEPFTGSAAVYWYLHSLRKQGSLRFGSSRLADSNSELINCYSVVRDQLEPLLKKLTIHRQLHEKTYYYQIRSLRVSELSPLEQAARFIYLNKTCFNGLYRVNRSGQFNVPMGDYENPRIFDEDELRSAGHALKDVNLAVADFRSILEFAQAGDFVYFDPPYAPLSKTASFTSYTKAPFAEKEQVELANVYKELDQRGCKVMLSNSWVEYLLDLYSGFKCIEVKASRAINSNAKKRGKISELLVINYEP